MHTRWHGCHLSFLHSGMVDMHSFPGHPSKNSGERPGKCYTAAWIHWDALHKGWGVPNSKEEKQCLVVSHIPTPPPPWKLTMLEIMQLSKPCTSKTPMDWEVTIGVQYELDSNTHHHQGSAEYLGTHGWKQPGKIEPNKDDFSEYIKTAPKVLSQNSRALSVC